jgi:hypothetical protein
MRDPFAAQRRIAYEGDFIKDMSPLKRSLGMVTQIDEDTGMMQVNFPKTGKLSWVIWDNHGQYIVV